MRGRRAGRTGFYFILPSLVGVSIFVLLPFGDVVRRSFFSALGGEFVGMQNYKSVLFNQAFLLAAGNTVRFLGVCMPLLLATSLALALLLYGAPERAGFLKTVFLLPMAAPVASIALLWQVLFHRHGLLNGWLVPFGVEAIDWMGSSRAFWVLVGTYLWKNIGYDMVLWLAGLAAISPSMLEAARVDGAGRFTLFCRITFPNLLPAFFTIAVLSFLNAFKVFREAYLVAGNYPQDSIYLLQHLFNNWFRDLAMDKLAAGAVLTALGVLILLLIFKKGLHN